KERGSSQVRAIAVTQGVALGYSMAPRKSGAQAPSRDVRLVLRFVDAPVISSRGDACVAPTTRTAPQVCRRDHRFIQICRDQTHQ
ncbi:MAG: hypothetical protein ACP5M0_15340, partial [Desulfomonilaceae bacterium]